MPNPPAEPRRLADRPVDAVTVLVGNASLLGVGYLLLRRRRLAAIAVAVAVFFLLVLAFDPDAVFWRILLVLWWAATLVHTWRLTRRQPHRRPFVDIDDPQHAWRSRLIAVGVAGLVLATGVGLRLDTWLIVRSAEQVHQDGDCERAIESLDRLGAPHRVAYGAMAATGAANLEACGLLLAADDQSPEAGADTIQSYLEHPGARWDGAGPKRAELLLTAARTVDGFEAVLKAGFAQLSVTLKETPGQSKRVEEVVEGFVADLAAEKSDCRVKQIDDWVYGRDWAAPEIAEPLAAASERVPERMLGCAGDRFEAGALETARDVYKQFLSEFPDHDEADSAADQLYKVESTIERREVKDLLEAEEYCDAPAAYRGAEPYKGAGPHEMWMFGLDPDSHGFPKSWKTRDVDDAVLAVCVEGPERGSYQQSCYYEALDSPGVRLVRFYASKFTIKAYEIRTGKRVASYTRQIGDPCPAVLTYETYGYGVDVGPPSEVESDYSDASARSMFDRLVD